MDKFIQAAKLIRSADGLLIGAGAGIGVDSGLPDFRSDNGFWKAYPALGKIGISFYQAANPRNFIANPALAWGFYGHRLKLYRETEPHDGFAVLLAIAATLKHGAFVYTSNVDGQFQTAGFDSNRIVECHGSIHCLQCTRASCNAEIWSAQKFMPEVDNETCTLINDPPLCPSCGGIARPNILMFGDANWLSERVEQQEQRWDAWRHRVKNLVVIEIGAGVDIPSVRIFCENTCMPIIRINPRDAELDGQAGVSLKFGALEALTGITRALTSEDR
jgi:NAD-dependent SIR2 family protein deacetylase